MILSGWPEIESGGNLKPEFLWEKQSLFMILQLSKEWLYLPGLAPSGEKFGI